ncbi:MAG: membrane protein insertase YidC [Myxococcales bacterium]
MNENPNDHQKRLVLVIILSMGMLFGWQLLATHMGWITVPEPAADAGVAQVDAGAVAEAPGAETPSPAPSEAPAAVADAPARSESFETPTQQLTFSSRGGGLSAAVLRSGERWKPYKFERRENKAEPGVQHVDMVRVLPSQPLPGATEITGELRLSPSTNYAMERFEDGVRLVAQSETVRVEKRYWLSPAGYELRLQQTITNVSGREGKASLSIGWPAYIDPKTEETGSFFSPPPELSQVICRHASDTEMVQYDKDGKKETFPGPVRFVGFDERYFLGAVFPRFTEGTSCLLEVDPVGTRSGTLLVDLGTLKPGESVTRDFGIYLGPKALEMLNAVSEANLQGAPLTQLATGAGVAPAGMPAAEKVDPELSNAIDFGWWAVVASLLLRIMKMFQQVVVNWGIAIILLTVLVKALLYPLTKKSMESMEAMKKLQPHMEALRKKYENDREKLNMEMMRLYQEHKVNPFGGCLPMLIQMPVWIALYRTLLSSFELYREPLLPFWITDLTAADPFYILPLAMGATMFITQKMQPQMGDPNQAKIMLYFMPVFFTFIMLNLPAGLTLYIFTNNLLSIAQQKYLQHRMAQKAKA